MRKIRGVSEKGRAPGGGQVRKRAHRTLCAVECTAAAETTPTSGGGAAIRPTFTVGCTAALSCRPQSCSNVPRISVAEDVDSWQPGAGVLSTVDGTLTGSAQSAAHTPPATGRAASTNATINAALRRQNMLVSEYIPALAHRTYWPGFASNVALQDVEQK